MMDIIMKVTVIFIMLILTETAFMGIMGIWRDGTVTKETRLLIAPGSRRTRPGPARLIILLSARALPAHGWAAPLEGSGPLEWGTPVRGISEAVGRADTRPGTRPWVAAEPIWAAGLAEAMAAVAADTDK